MSKHKQIFSRKKLPQNKNGEKNYVNEIKVVKNIFSQTLHGRSMAGAKQQEFASKNESGDRALVRILILGWWGVGLTIILYCLFLFSFLNTHIPRGGAGGAKASSDPH